MINFCDFIQVYVFTTNHHLKPLKSVSIVVVFAFLAYIISTPICHRTTKYDVIQPKLRHPEISIQNSW